jgi:MFS transporter, ACS family, tartrate transporter
VAALVTERDPVSRAVALAFRRLLPLLVLMHVIAYADRVNITFAETEISDDLAVVGDDVRPGGGDLLRLLRGPRGPSNLVLHRVGAPRWMGRIMITCGIVAAATAFVWDATSVIAARILLGVGEAGFFPGVVYLISCWFPERDRARAMGVFMLGIVIAAVIGGPLSGGLLELDGVLGLEGWQRLFLGQGVPAVAVGAWVLRALPSSPAERPGWGMRSAWLSSVSWPPSLPPASVVAASRCAAP